MIGLKRAYEPPAHEDGQRVLVDRVWPRGVSRESLKLDSWQKDLAPSTALRRWFNHDPQRWPEFVRRYREELQRPEYAEALDALAEQAQQGALTLVYGARDTEHNQAVVLGEVIGERLVSR